jgi:hypothetical protein
MILSSRTVAPVVRIKGFADYWPGQDDPDDPE